MTRCTGLFLVVLVMNGCDRSPPAMRRYRELAPPPQAPIAADAIPAAAPDARLQWTAPAGWVDRGASSMRLATFQVGSDGGECTITVFPGDVGGLEANLRRWLGQLKADVADAELARFARAPVTLQSEGNLACLIYDFAGLLPADHTHSLLAAVVPRDGVTAFIKFTGPRVLLAAEKENFYSLCRSLKP